MSAVRKRRTAGIACALTILLQPAGHAEAAPANINVWTCRPPTAHPQPVVLLHGTGENENVWSTLGPRLAKEGYCVFALTYGVLPNGPLGNAGGMDSMRRSASELDDFIAHVRSATGASKVDIVGHSQGALMPEYYVKFLGGNLTVAKYVSLAPLWDGTTRPLAPSLVRETPLESLGGEVMKVLCEACRELLHGSDFLNTLRANGVLSPEVEYTNIMTADDDVVVPYTSGYVSAANATNIMLTQVSHAGLLSDSAASLHVLSALDHG